MCARVLLMCARVLLMCARVVLMCSRVLLMCARVLLMCANLEPGLFDMGKMAQKHDVWNRLYQLSFAFRYSVFGIPIPFRLI